MEKTCVDRWTSAMVTWLITFILIPQVESQEQLIIEQSPKNATVSVGETVVLTCVFSQPVDCNWMKDDQPFRIKSGDGNTFTGDRSDGLETRDCSIKISHVTENDFAKWHCASFASKGIAAVSSEGIWITKRVTPSAPVVLFNNKIVLEIKLPSSETARDNMVCVSENGNPAAELSWETNGTPYLGRLEKVEVSPNNYTVKLFWDRGGGWQIFDNSTEVVCKAKHPGFTTTMAARVQFKRNHAPRRVKVWTISLKDYNVSIRCGESVLLACISDGHPQPTYTWERWTEEDKTWKLFNSHNSQNITVTIELLGKYRCKASNDLNKYSPTPSINQLTVSEQDETTNGLGLSAMVAIVLGVTLVITIIVSTACIIRLRRKLKMRNNASPSALPMVDQLNAGATKPRKGNRHTTSPVSGGTTALSTNRDMVLYDDARSHVRQCNDRRANTDSNGYLVPLPVYEEIKGDQPSRVKGEDDNGYIALL